ncbi:MAG: VCBS repeat-containing protein, partial [Pseudomonadota bacterium]
VLVRYDNGERVICDTVLAGPERVFEDTAPRLADMNGDGVNEVIAVACHQSFGARREHYGYTGLGQDFQLLSHTPYIGTAFRWLAPVGVADFDDDGRLDIAYVETPHLGKTLKIVTPEGEELVEIASASGFSNHRIGERFISGGIRDCGDGPEIVLVDGAWRRVVAVRMEATELVSRDLDIFETHQDLETMLKC